MSKQITVRLPDEIVEFIDRLVDDKLAPSRATVVARAMERERRRDLAARDAAILAALSENQGPDGAGADDLDELASYAGSTPLTDLD
ncbi:antitoxin [Kribbella sp. NBC_01245]|uniref:ribbon-helix-helix domain-containing protein n=1 Tax=Kribbella sp. NBC_01245 TaxID=2903578 RepID=UPI002E2E04E5|nr:YlcI/YnfO family protein [Kribbella sp. NBC_01245]